MVSIRHLRKALTVSGNFKKMRRFTIFTLFLFALLPAVTFGQTKKVDLQIDNLSNQELVGQCNWVWVLKAKPGIVDSLIHIGKPATKQLFNVLTSNAKGIVAHYILSRIWFNDFNIRTSFENFEKDGIIEYQIGSLTFYENEAGLKFTKPGDLERIKDEWETIIDNKSSH